MPKIVNIILAALMFLIVCTSYACAGTVNEYASNTVTVQVNNGPQNQLDINQGVEAKVGDKIDILFEVDNDLADYIVLNSIDCRFFKVQSTPKDGIYHLKLEVIKSGSTSTSFVVFEKPDKYRCTRTVSVNIADSCKQVTSERLGEKSKNYGSHNYQENEWNKDGNGRHYKGYEKDNGVTCRNDRYGYNNHRS